MLGIENHHEKLWKLERAEDGAAYCKIGTVTISRVLVLLMKCLLSHGCSVIWFELKNMGQLESPAVDGAMFFSLFPSDVLMSTSFSFCQPDVRSCGLKMKKHGF